MIGYYNYTVILTYVSLFSAIFGITFAFTGNVQLAVFALMLSGLCDMFDGTVARLRKNRTEEEVMFGAHIDSLSDLVAFGVLPASILYGLGGKEWYCIVVMAIFALCALIRLAYFDVQEILHIEKSEKRTHFTGLPVTNVAVIVPIYLSLNLIFKFNNVYYYMVGLLITAFFYVAPIKIKKLYMPWLLIMAVIGAAAAVVFAIYGGVFNS